MKILIFAPYFPPYNAIGSIRAANFVQYLLSQNVDVRVISAAHSELDQSQYSPISSDKVIFVKWSDSNPQYQLQRHANIELSKTIQKQPGFFAFLRVILRSLLYWPDRHQFWVTPACKEANRMLEDWKPNLIFASALPASALLAAKQTSETHRIPWVAEFRDLWAGNEFNETWRVKELFEGFWEKKILSSASLIVTVSEHLASILRERHRQEVDVVLNGFLRRNIKKERPQTRSSLVIRHTGSLYEGKRDPSALFSAISQLGPEKQYVKVEFFGPESELVNRLAKKYKVQDIVTGFPKVPHHECTQLQAEADILLLIMWTDKRERDIYTGKFFEYASTDNPILLLGNSDSTLSQEIKTNHLGAVASSEAEIFEMLKTYIQHFRNDRNFRRSDNSGHEKYSSAYQFASLYRKMKDVAKI